MREWDYANMAHMAKIHGGPEQYVDLILKKGMQDGIKQGRIEAALVLLGAAAGGVIVKTIVDKKQSKRKVSDEEYRKAREALISEIKEEMKADKEKNNYEDEPKNNQSDSLSSVENNDEALCER